MYKSEVLGEVGVRHDPRTRVENLQLQAQNIQRKLDTAEKLERTGRGPSKSKIANLRFQLGQVVGKLSEFPTRPSVYV